MVKSCRFRMADQGTSRASCQPKYLELSRTAASKPRPLSYCNAVNPEEIFGSVCNIKWRLLKFVKQK